MKLQSLLSRPSAPRHLSMALIGVWSLILVLGVGWTFIAVRSRSMANEATLACRDLEGRIAEAESSISRASRSPDAKVPKGLAIISSFQSTVTKIADKWGCTLNEFQATPQLSEYLTRFAKDTRPSDWKQIEVAATLRGPAPFLVSALKEIADCGLPFEFNTIDLRRFSNSQTGGGIVICALALRLVTRTPENGS